MRFAHYKQRAVAWCGAGLMLSICLSGCLDEKSLIRTFAPEEEEKFARQFIDSIKNARYDEAKKMLDPRVTTTPEQLQKLREIVDHGDLLKLDLVGAHTGFFGAAGTGLKRNTQLTYQLQFQDGWVMAAIEILKDEAGLHVTSANFRPLPGSLETLNRLTFTGKSIFHYLVFSAVIAVPVFIVTTVVICARSSIRRRWLWILFMIFGLGQLQLNWTTGKWVIQPLSILILGAAGFRDGSYGPWILSVGLPIGAIVFLSCRRDLCRTD